MHTIDKAAMLEKLKHPTKTQIGAAKAVFQAMAFEKCVREKIEPRQKFCLDLIKAVDKRTGERITDVKHSYRMTDEQYKEYEEEMNHELMKLGYTSDRYQKEGYCPLLEAKNLVLKAQQVLIYAMEETTGFTYDQVSSKLEFFDTYIDINLKYLVNFIK